MKSYPKEKRNTLSIIVLRFLMVCKSCPFCLTLSLSSTYLTIQKKYVAKVLRFVV